MPAPIVPTQNNLDPLIGGFRIVEQIQYLAGLVGSDAAPALLSTINNYDQRRLLLEAITQLRDINVKFEEGNLVRFEDTILTAVQVKALAAANIEVVPAPPAGFANVPVSVHMFLFHAGTNDFIQTNATDHLALLYNGGSEITEIATAAQLTTFLEASASAALRVHYGVPEGATPAGLVPVAATAIDLDNNGAAEYTGNAADDNTLSIRVGYATVPMAAFS